MAAGELLMHVGDSGARMWQPRRLQKLECFNVAGSMFQSPAAIQSRLCEAMLSANFAGISLFAAFKPSEVRK